MLCTACGKPPINNQKLLICRNCQCAVYHDTNCQRRDWKRHKKVCSQMGSLFIPLRRILLLLHVNHNNNNNNGNDESQDDEVMSGYWWDRVSQKDQEIHESEWVRGYQLWNGTYDGQPAYLKAMKHFQDSLEPYSYVWENWKKQQENFHQQPRRDVQASPPTDSSWNHHHHDTKHFILRRHMELAKRLLFCAYCEIDGQSIDLGRQRLLQCISILLFVGTTTTTTSTTSTTTSQRPDDMIAIWDDAWMELILSLEETRDQQQFATTAVALVLDACRQQSEKKKKKKKKKTTIRAPCGWTDAWQRPGFMSGCIVPTAAASYCGVYQDGPKWCHQLEENFKTVLEEYEQIRSSSMGWSTVGSGDRGSGMSDHRVVVGQDWSEYVLFGTGQDQCPHATKTRLLIRHLIPDAVSIAEQGGGEVIFSRLAPHTHIEAHCGTTNLRLTAHLGLVVPRNLNCDEQEGPKCQIRVGETWHRWETGKILLFDDSFEHEVRNDTNEERVVLLLRFWHPWLPKDRRQEALEKARQKKSEAVEKRYHPSKPLL